MIRTYNELLSLETLEDRFNYLKLDGSVGVETFGHRRYLNQAFYTSTEWRRFRNSIIIRDNACELALPENDIHGLIVIHHLNPITYEMFLSDPSLLLDENNVVCVSPTMHKAIHYGDFNFIKSTCAERSKNDTCPWKL